MRVQFDARSWHDQCSDSLAPAFVRQAHHRDLGHARQSGDHIFQFAREDVETAADDHVLLPVDDVKIAVGIEAAHVARVQPTACKCDGGFLGPLPVASHHMRPAHTDLADIAGGHGPQLFVQ